MSARSIKIGVMDSGLGGLSVLNELTNLIPTAEYIYYGDLKNSPYGNKSPQVIFKFVEEICNFFMGQDVSAIVVACNTATSVAISELRKKFPIQIFGMEPAIKPALLENPNEKIALLATPLTLKEEKYLNLEKSLDAVNRIIPIACDGLATLIDKADFTAIEEYLKPIIEDINKESIRTIVLGCTHYVLIKSIFYQLKNNIHIYDGNKGTANHVSKSLITFPYQIDTRLDIFLNGGTDLDFEIAYSYLNQFQNGDTNYVK